MRRHHQKESRRDQKDLVGGPCSDPPSDAKWKNRHPGCMASATWLPSPDLPHLPSALPWPPNTMATFVLLPSFLPKVVEVKVKVVAMQKALLAASRTNLFGHFGGGAAAVSVRVQNGGSRVGWKGMVTKAGEQVEQAGEDPKVDISSSDEDKEARMHPHTRKAYRDDMEESYGVGYATRASEMGYGERYGEAVKAVLDKKGDEREMQRGATSERDQHADAFADPEYDTTQGEPVAQKEVGRNSEASNAFESQRTVHTEETIHEEMTIHKEKTVLE